MRHPAYKIIEVINKDGIRTEKVASKELMFKCDAERVINWKNRNDAVFLDANNSHYWMVADKDHHPVSIPRLSKLPKGGLK